MFLVHSLPWRDKEIMETIGHKTHTLTSAGFKKSTFQDYAIYYLANPNPETITKAAQAILKKIKMEILYKLNWH